MTERATASGARSRHPPTTPPARPDLSPRLPRGDRRDPGRLGSDPIAVTYARMNGFSARTFRRPPGSPPSPDGEHAGALRGRARHGATHYVVRYGPALGCCARSSSRSARGRGGCGGLAFMFGYLRAALAASRGSRTTSSSPTSAGSKGIGCVSGLRRSRAGRTATTADSPRPRDPGAGSRDRVLERRERVIEVARRLESYGDRQRLGRQRPLRGAERDPVRLLR